LFQNTDPDANLKDPLISSWWIKHNKINVSGGAPKNIKALISLIFLPPPRNEGMAEDANGYWRESRVDASRAFPPGGEDILPAHKAAPLDLSAEHEQQLKQLVRAHSTPQKLAERARIILLAATGLGITETAGQLGIWRKTASHWRQRWQIADASTGVAARLADAPRCGAPAKFTAEVICQIMALACQDPETLDVPISQWSQSELARQSVARGIVTSISHGSVGRFLKNRPASSRISTATG
jgi:transposase